jgi:hypothetical protein
MIVDETAGINHERDQKKCVESELVERQPSEMEDDHIPLGLARFHNLVTVYTFRLFRCRLPRVVCYPRLVYPGIEGSTRCYLSHCSFYLQLQLTDLHHVSMVHDALMTMSAVEARHSLVAMIDFRADGDGASACPDNRRSIR